MISSLAAKIAALAAILSLVQSAAALDLANDTSNCGRAGRICAPKDNGKVYCDAGTCRVNCNEGWIQANNLCKETKQHKKLRLSKPVSLCPSGESACPIQGAKSFVDFPSADRSSESFLYSLSARPGGFECLDVTTSLESCGGCASTGQGKDCTQIQHAEGVGCSGGQCHILSCQNGFALSADGQECHQRARKLTHGHRHKKNKRL